MPELAPAHKLGLFLENPVMLAGGSVGYGEAVHRDLDLNRFGAVVVGPITRRSSPGSEPPRLAETTGGFVRHTGLQNRGVTAAVKRYVRVWSRLGCAVIAQVADNTPEDTAETVRRLATVESLHGLELLCRPDATPTSLAEQVQIISWESDLPVLVKLPLDRALELAPKVIEAGAAGVVIGCPPTGASFRPDAVPVIGKSYGPGVFPLMLATLLEITALGLPGSVTASGGIHTAEQVRQCLAVGADALQLDSLVWIEPAAAMALVDEVEE